MTIEYNFKFAFTPCLPAALNMGIDDLLGSDFPYAVPAVRFFTWSGYAISVGRNQDPEKRLNLNHCLRDGIDVVKRPTGGKELLHGSDLCYSVVWPRKGSGAGFDSTELFERINRILVKALSRFGIDAASKAPGGRSGRDFGPCFTRIDRGEIAVDGKKLMASAQRVYSGAILQQGSMPLRRPGIDLSEYLERFDREQVRIGLEQGTTSFFERCRETIEESSIVEAFREEFELDLGNGYEPLDMDLIEIKLNKLKQETYKEKVLIQGGDT